MIQRFIDRFMTAITEVKADLRANEPASYDDLVKRLITLLHDDSNTSPSVERITIIDHGEYQGTRLYIIGEDGYQPSTYWSIFVNYGSCSGCDAFQAIQDNYDRSVDYDERKLTDAQVDSYWTLMLHMVQQMRVVGGKA